MLRLARRSLVGLLLVLGWSDFSAAQAGNPPTSGISLPRLMLAPAPEFPAALEWLNTGRPLSLRELRGKVVLLDFWTYGCINCLHILPDLRRLEAAFAEVLVVIGVHSAKYDNEAALANLSQAVQRYGMTHAVVNDRDFRIWQAYRVPGWPTQILIDPEGNILQGFVGENHYQRVHHLITATVALHRQRGTLREGAGPPQVASTEPRTSLRYPGKILADAASSRLFIADTQHHRLLITDLQGTVIAVIGRGQAGADDGSFAAATLRQPQGMALQGSLLYVADTGNHLLRRVDLVQRVVTTVVGTGNQATERNVPGYGLGVALSSPWDLYRHGTALYIAMAGVHQIWRLHLDTRYAEPFVGSGSEALVDGRYLEAGLGQPSGLSGDGQVVYVADSEVNAVRAINLAADGVTTTLAGGEPLALGDHQRGSRAAGLQHPLDVAYAQEMVYVTDTYNHTIKRLDLRSGQMQTFAGTGQAGYRDGVASQAQFYEPGGLSVSAGKLYVADTNNHRVRIIDLTTQTVTTLPLSGLPMSPW